MIIIDSFDTIILPVTELIEMLVVQNIEKKVQEKWSIELHILPKDTKEKELDQAIKKISTLQLTNDISILIVHY